MLKGAGFEGDITSQRTRWKQCISFKWSESVSFNTVVTAHLRLGLSGAHLCYVFGRLAGWPPSYFLGPFPCQCLGPRTSARHPTCPAAGAACRFCFHGIYSSAQQGHSRQVLLISISFPPLGSTKQFLHVFNTKRQSMWFVVMERLGEGHLWGTDSLVKDGVWTGQGQGAHSRQRRKAESVWGGFMRRSQAHLPVRNPHPQ